MTVAEALEEGTRFLAEKAGAPQARSDCALLLRFATGLSATAILAFPERPVSSLAEAAFRVALERRARSEPMQYIVGRQEFFGLEFRVSPAVLIPRPETEHLIEAALQLAQPARESAQILDVGTGSGAIAVSLAYQLPAAHITATDNSAAALQIARENAIAHGVSDRIRFLECDLLPGEATSTFDLICSNPPYVPSGEVLEPQVQDFEPHSALFAGPDGLSIYRRLIPLAALALRPGGTLLLELGYGQVEAIEGLLGASQLQNIRFVPDLRGIQRVALAERAKV